MSVHPLTLKRLGRQPSAEIAQSKYDELEAEVTTTVRGKLSARKMHVVDDDLEEAYNQAWHGVCEKIMAGEKIDNLTGILVLVTWRRAVDIYRANHPSEHEDVDVLERGVEPDLAAEVDDREKLKRLFSRLKGRLNQREQAAVSLCILHGYSRPEAAKLLKVPEPALQKVMDGAMKKIGGIVASLSARGCGNEDAGLIRAYAFSAIDDDREYHRAAEHVEQCESCRRYVRGLQGLAAMVADDGALVLHQRFIELDRGTARPAEQLAAKITRYTRLRYYTPASAAAPDAPAEPLWRRYYRSWPHLLIVLADQSERRMRQRIRRTLALYESDPGKDHRIAIPVSFVGLDDLLSSGPFAHVFVTADHPGRPVNWLGEATTN
ncbi:MAG TPA: sigma-70 family RNA polymerase sigma factor [Solirubrobacteraceae bacterium]|jgi:DNA-directed RNA polymerase specialized sigma24 family protein|nr:sigma-70 family RNA polymerase sigma factor [Solirubrobacteraceae bacterium]